MPETAEIRNAAEAIEQLGAEIFSHAVAINLLVQKAIEDDPEFGAKALGLLDTWLGQRAARGEAVDPFVVRSREAFAKLLEPITELAMPPAPPPIPPTRTPTLRKRFLNWLERG